MRKLAAKSAFLILALLLGSMAHAEFRVFRLTITDEKTGKNREVLTTLDPDQYRGYHHVKSDEQVEMVNSWMCWKRNDYTESLCPDPGPGANAAPDAAPMAGSIPGADAPR